MVPQLVEMNIAQGAGQFGRVAFRSDVPHIVTTQAFDWPGFRLESGTNNIAAVDEVTQVPDRITRVPRTPKFLEGVVNLRGEILPVVDQRRRFDMPPLTCGDRRRLVVVRTQRHRAGLIVAVVGIGFVAYGVFCLTTFTRRRLQAP